MEQIKIEHRKDQGKIVIELPVELLVFALHNNPNDKTTIHDNEAFADEVVKQIEGYYTENSKELGITAFQEFIDEIMAEAVMNADEKIATIHY